MAKKINEVSSMPQMGAAFQGWEHIVTLKRITQTVVDGFVTNAEEDFSFKGVVQPLSPRQINLKPEGQRAFTWLQIHCFSGTLNLTTNDRIQFDDKDYKIMGVYDFNLDNFVEYHAVEDFQ